jgi:hypothetical protein
MRYDGPGNADGPPTLDLCIVGIAAAGLNILLAPVVLSQQGPQLGTFSKGLASLSFLSILAVSIIITFVQFKAVDLINTYGNDIGVYAYGEDKYIVFTWVAVIVMLLGAAAELFGERIASWNIPRVWSGIYQGCRRRVLFSSVLIWDWSRCEGSAMRPKKNVRAVHLVDK